MIQFNLLPDVKLAFIKAERTKKLVISIAVLTTSVALFIFIALYFTVNVAQKKNLSDLNKDIKTDTAIIQNTPNVNKILTIQSQLSTLTGLHDQKAQASRLFDYIAKVTPANVTISNIATDFAQHTIAISGNSVNLDALNTYVDTLKFTKYTSDKNSTATNAFSSVVLSSFSRSKDSSTYMINLSYDEPLFNVTNKINFEVPNTVTTRSVTEQPTLFKKTETKR